MLLPACQRQKENASAMPPNALGPLTAISFEAGGTTVDIEIAIKPKEQEQGLMYRNSMPKDHGMLFVYDETVLGRTDYLTFWMGNTKIPLSIAFMLEDGTITNIEDMKPQVGSFPPVERYRASRKDCFYALEMNKGWFEKHGIKPGDVFPLPFEKIRLLWDSKTN